MRTSPPRTLSHWRRCRDWPDRDRVRDPAPIRVRVRVRVVDRTAGSTSLSIPMAIPIPTRGAWAAARVPRHSSPSRPSMLPLGNRIGIDSEEVPSACSPYPGGIPANSPGSRSAPRVNAEMENNPGGVEESPAFAPLPGCGIHHDAPFPGCVLRTTRGYRLPSLRDALGHPGNLVSSSAGDDTIRTARASCQSWPSSWISSIRARNASLHGPKRA
jgi:hypothetical protein